MSIMLFFLKQERKESVSIFYFNILFDRLIIN